MFLKIIFLTIFTNIILNAAVTKININETSNYLNNNIPIIDIRTEQEWKKTGIIKNSYLITPLNQNGAFNIKEFEDKLKVIINNDKNNEFILISKNEGKSKKLAKFLSNKRKYKSVYYVEGGFINWIRKGGKVTKYKKVTSKN